MPSPSDSARCEPSPSPSSAEDTSSDYRTLSNGYLNPRHRRLTQLAAQGLSNAQIAKELGYVDSRISILLKNPVIQAEIERLQNRIFEETIQQRLKTLAEPALQNIQDILTDQTRKVKVSEKADMSRWVIEKLDGKATQKIDAGENLLASLMDRLDHRRQTPSSPRPVGDSDSPPDIEVAALPAGQTEHDTESQDAPDPLADWVISFDASK